MGLFENIDKKYLNNLFIVLFIEIFIIKGPCSALSKLLLRNFDGFQLQFYMFGIALVAFSLALNKRLSGIGEMSRGELLSTAMNSIPYYCSYLFMLLALKTTPAVEVSMLVNLYPIMIIILAAFINDERLGIINILAVTAGFAGGLVILVNGDFSYLKISNFSGDLLALGSAASYAVFSCLSKKSKKVTLLNNYINIFVSFILSFLSLFLFSEFKIPEAGAVAGLLWVGIANGALSLFLWVRALRLGTVNIIAAAIFLVPVASIAFIVLLLGEKISLCQLAGFAIIISSIALSTYNSNRKSPRKQHSVNR